MKWLRVRWFKTIMLTILGMILALVGYGLLQLIEPVSLAPITTSQSIKFSGRALLVASDADMVATAYADGKLERVAGVEDTLTVIGLQNSLNSTNIRTLRVSNSVMSWPQIIAVSPNGQRAYVVEVRRRPNDDNIQAFDSIDQMPDGQQLTVVDIADLSKPKVLESIAIGRNPEHVSISPDGRFLAVNLEESGRELAIIQLQKDGRLGKR